MRRLPILALTLALGAAASCKSGGPSMQSLVGDLKAQIDAVFGAKSLPGRHLGDIEAAHESVINPWRLRADQPDALMRTSNAVQALATCEYARWEESAIAVHILSSMAEKHPSALIRATAFDTLARMGEWAIPAADLAVAPTTENDVKDAITRLRNAARAPAGDASASADVARAVSVFASYRFDTQVAPPEGADFRNVGRILVAHFNMANTVLGALTSDVVVSYAADPAVHDALELGRVTVSASAIRAGLLAGATADPSEIVRAAAVRNLAVIRPEIGAAVLSAAVRRDLASAVRREAARALGSYPAAESVPALLDALGDDMPDVRSAAAQSLRALSGQDFREDRALWRRWWQSGGASAPSAR